MIGSIIGGAVGALGSIFGGISASKAMKKVKGNLEEQKQENQAWYDRRYNEDATQRADAQRILTMTQEAIKNRNKAAAGAQAVGGLTEESVAAEKAANAKSLADATSQIAVAGDRRKDMIEQQYQHKDARLDDALNNLEINKANQIATAVKGVADAGAGIASAF
ncbi:MAG: hypothetical protein J1E78_08075 [Muribaculaceae bacterium]|nr:hypothetical protein [Muribaculaceae bacterium]